MLIIALVFPWWSLQGASENVQTSSTLYLIPLTLVSTTITPQVIGGDVTVLPDVFPTIMMVIPILTVLAGVFTLFVLIMKRRYTERWLIPLLLGVLVLLFCSVMVYLGAMSAFTDVGVGSIVGNGSIDISVPGQDVVTPISCQWGLGLGFWLYVVASLLSLSILILIVYQKKKKRNRLL
jgi:hypothetical protein